MCKSYIPSSYFITWVLLYSDDVDGSVGDWYSF